MFCSLKRKEKQDYTFDHREDSALIFNVGFLSPLFSTISFTAKIKSAAEITATRMYGHSRAAPEHKYLKLFIYCSMSER